jgi:hypothetical protein
MAIYPKSLNLNETSLTSPRRESESRRLSSLLQRTRRPPEFEERRSLLINRRTIIAASTKVSWTNVSERSLSKCPTTSDKEGPRRRTSLVIWEERSEWSLSNLRFMNRPDSSSKSSEESVLRTERLDLGRRLARKTFRMPQPLCKGLFRGHYRGMLKRVSNKSSQL